MHLALAAVGVQAKLCIKPGGGHGGGPGWPGVMCEPASSFWSVDKGLLCDWFDRHLCHTAAVMSSPLGALGWRGQFQYDSPEVAALRTELQTNAGIQVATAGR